MLYPLSSPSRFIAKGASVITVSIGDETSFSASSRHIPTAPGAESSLENTGFPSSGERVPSTGAQRKRVLVGAVIACRNGSWNASAPLSGKTRSAPLRPNTRSLSIGLIVVGDAPGGEEKTDGANEACPT